MADNDFVHLHFHTQYSLLDGACRVKDAVAKAKRLGMPGLAITDHGVMFGTIDFYNQCKKADIKPIIGCELYTTNTNMLERKKNLDGSQSNHMLMLAKDLEGYHNLARLSSAGHIEGFYYKPRVDIDRIAQHAKGLIATTTCLKGEIPEMIKRGQMDEAMARAGQYMDIFDKGDYYVELQDHGLPEQKTVNRGLIELAKRLELPLVATNDVHYIEREHSKAHEVLLCLQTQTTMNDPGRLKYGSDQFYMKSQDEMAMLFGDIPGALSNTIEIMEKTDIEFKLGLDADLHFPIYVIPPEHTDRSYLIEICKEGLYKKYGMEDLDKPKNADEQVLHDRFYFELSVIEKTGFVNYFLVVWDFIAWAKTQNIPVGPGRGSGAGSIVAYLMSITEVDPIKYVLLFERFLNPDRISPPDFDIDFCQQRRGEVIEYTKDKYGRENCAQIITFGTLGAKMVIRDISRVLDIPLSEADKLAKLIPEDPGMTLEKAVKANPDFKKAIATDPNAKRIMEYAWILEGLPRNQGTHAAGVVIGEKPLAELIPLCRDKEKQAVTQYEMKPLEMTGLLKMDFLGLKTLTVVQEAIDNIKETQDIDIDLLTMDLEDEATFDLLNRGDTAAVFQVESKGMREWLQKFKLAKFEDLIAMIALYRPGPMDNLPDFVDRRHKRVEIKYDHPLLEPILKETYGVMIYQEQVQQASAALGGFTLAQGDLLRRAMGKKDPAIMVEQRKKFIEGCKVTNNMTEKLSGQIFDNIEKFAGYGFNKSHSAAYAFISWHTAFLKTHYPVEFWCGVLSCEMGNPEKLSGFIEGARMSGIDVLPPSVNGGGARFKPEGEAIRFGMAGIKGVGADAVEELVKDRKANGPFTGLTDFCMRLPNTVANKRVLEALIMSGAFDFTGMYRSRLFDGVEFAMSRASSIQKDRAAGQGSLFDALDASADDGDVPDEFPEVPAWPEKQMLRQEKDLIGFYISGHPLDQFKWDLKLYAQLAVDDFDQAEPGSVVRVGGLVTKYRKLFTKKSQEAMGAFTIETKAHSIEAVMFPSAFKDFGDNLYEDHPCIIVGEVAKDEPDKLFAQEAYPLAEAHRLFCERLELHFSAEPFDEELLHLIAKTLMDHPGQTPVVICQTHPSGHIVRMQAGQDIKVSVTGELYKALGYLIDEEQIEPIVHAKPNLREQKKRSFRKTA